MADTHTLRYTHSADLWGRFTNDNNKQSAGQKDISTPILMPVCQYVCMYIHCIGARARCTLVKTTATTTKTTQKSPQRVT